MNFLAFSICRLRKFASVFDIISNTAVDKFPWSGKRHIREITSLKGNVKVAFYGLTIARALRTKAYVICAPSKENFSVSPYFITLT